jgi:hypothetical protein
MDRLQNLYSYSSTLAAFPEAKLRRWTAPLRYSQAFMLHPDGGRLLRALPRLQPRERATSLLQLGPARGGDLLSPRQARTCEVG